ncbi:DUF1850 domain-containing protein [Ammoniphilus sp. YIM 78166]|uniref:DUF1850 domain-containing protein n=1 Tax=Ammoniphilus sp. YIM 78166 TaxID=1644106 RepID=UPI001430D89E|nr:DUF1850 domain-containing protein [Ammoniphilus sp. YIM 78166]
MKIKVAFTILFPLLILFLAWPTQLALTITDGKSGQQRFAVPMELEDSFGIEFVHSIHKTPVIEEYYIDEQLDIVLDQVIYESYGVGMPSTIEPGQTYKQENGKYIISNIQRRLKFIDLAIGQMVANHQLKIHNRKVPFSQINPPGSWVRIQVKNVSLLTIWKGEWEYGK